MARIRAAAAAVVVVCLTACAQASGFAPLTIGFSNAADVVLTSSNTSSNAVWAARAHAEGAKMIRLTASWDDIAPAVRPAGFIASNPASAGYNWTQLDQAVRDLTESGFEVLLTVVNAPTWAEGPGMPRGATPGSWKPSATDLGAFATALAIRYSGRFADPKLPGKTLPRISDWAAWNEPNLSIDLAPQWRHTDSGFQPESPVIYREMENAFYEAVKLIEPSNFVVQAGVAPYGDYPAGGARMPPVTFDQALFCLNAKQQPQVCPDPVHLDAIDSHPYGIYGPTWHALDPGDVAVPDVVKLTKLLHAAERAGTVLPRGPKQDWVTEISWDTNPPNPGGVPVMKEARWLEQSFYVLWSQGVDTVLWFQLADAPPIPSYQDAYEGGLYFLNGQAKPGAIAFRFPFLTNRVSTTTVEAWGRAPATGPILIQQRSHGDWLTIGRVAGRAGAVFEAKLALTGKAQLRATLDQRASLTWPQSA